MMRALATVLLVGCVRAAGPPAVANRLPELSLNATDGSVRAVADLASGAPATVITFFSASCPCQHAHDARLVALYERFRAKGVRLLVVDSEVSRTLGQDAEEARARGYPFPVVLDPGGRLADALGAEFATYSIVADAAGRIVYRGGLDSDRTHLRDDAVPFVRNAVEALLAGKSPPEAEQKALGCALLTR